MISLALTFEVCEFAWIGELQVGEEFLWPEGVSVILLIDRGK